MASILDHETKIQVPSKVQGDLNLSDVADVHRVWRIRAQRAIRVVREDAWGKARGVLVQFRVDRNGIGGSRQILMYHNLIIESFLAEASYIDSQEDIGVLKIVFNHGLLRTAYKTSRSNLP